MTKLVELRIKDFRAIKEADIHINGITVVSGVNGSGKSTLSKLLYYSFKNANDFDKLLLQYINMQLRPYINVLDQLSNICYHHVSKERGRTINRSIFLRNYILSNINDGPLFIEEIKELCNRFIELENYIKLGGDSLVSVRLDMIIRSTLKITDSKLSLNQMLDMLIYRIDEHIQKIERMSVERPYKILRDSIDGIFDINVSKNVLLQEYDDCILGEKVINVPLPI